MLKFLETKAECNNLREKNHQILEKVRDLGLKKKIVYFPYQGLLPKVISYPRARLTGVQIVLPLGLLKASNWEAFSFF